MIRTIEGQIERFAPGFRSRILKRNVIVAVDLKLHNLNLVGGCFPWQGLTSNIELLSFRPLRRSGENLWMQLDFGFKIEPKRVGG